MNAEKLTNNEPNWAMLGALRFMLALIVSGQHIYDTLGQGNPYPLQSLGSFTAVEIFLAISGFSIRASYEKNQTGFGRRRFWRVAPMYWLSVIAAYAGFALWGPIISFDFGATWVFPGWLAFAQHMLFLQPVLQPVFVPMNPALWSLGVEVVFYATVPLLYSTGPKVALTGVLLSVVATTCFVFRFEGVWPYVQCFWAFGLGWLFYGSRTNTAARMTFPLAFTGTVLARLPASGNEHALSWLLALAGSSIIAFNGRLRIGGPTRRIAVYLGDLSFPLYVLHSPVLWAVNLSGLCWLPPVTMAAALALSACALSLIDRPFRKLGRPRRFPAGATLTCRSWKGRT